MRSLRRLEWLLASTRRPRRRRRKGCKKFAAVRAKGGSPAGWSKLPQDLQEEIFTHLPFEQVFQSRLVCKQWHQILSDAAFLKRNLAFQKACSYCVIISTSRDGGGSIGSGFDPESGSWQAMPPVPAELGSLRFWASDKGLLVARSKRHGCLCVYNPLLQTYRLLPPSGGDDEDTWLGMYVQLLVGADSSSFKVLQFSFYGKQWEKLPHFRLVPRVPDNQLGIQEVLVPLKNGFSKVHVYDSTSNSWSLLSDKPHLNFTRSDHPYSPPKGPCRDSAGGFWFEARERLNGSMHLASFVTFDSKQGVWKEQLKPPDEEWAGATDNSFVTEHLVHCGAEFLFLRTTTRRTSPENKLGIIFHFYRFDGLTGRWVVVRRTGLQLPPFHPANFSLLLAFLMGNQVVCKDKVLWFSVDLCQVIAFDMRDGNWRHYYPSEKHRQDKVTPFSFVPSVINLAGMSSAMPLAREGT